MLCSLSEHLFFVTEVTFYMWPFIINLFNTGGMPTMKGDIPQATGNVWNRSRSRNQVNRDYLYPAGDKS